ncbi:uncharacterized protein HMPREF1541_00763 [Cyphellophora europaea CBS 101466]|uniref:Peptide hydrolase n=1 Tax=Cyphellophora europaea (strain CBS 101466) TaxID=1220924 RepID=W2SEW9_CYPE1|nr:uncharacterized protein HMPREF1541_00763 [Cyphellophora europaea CBS 101466]ETN46578.1 hypothetical protein HMPREF1541_00763 [Cyphellophora europaea CBS 101466]
MARLSNPLAFARGPVTVIATLIYLAVIIPLIVVQTGVPKAPKSPRPVKGIDLDEAWADLQRLTRGYHPFNSVENDQVHNWLVQRVHQIVKENTNSSAAASSHPAYIFDDDVSNLTFSSPGTLSTPGTGISVYFESKNIIAYVPGREDDSSEWWAKPDGSPRERNGLLVNAHYDSVSSGYGATDDGVGCITVLQLLKYYTTPGNQPKHGIVLLWNDGEEDFLNGARVFSQHPMAKLVSSFLNLEGAGAGGRAALFRSTDTEVTRAYGESPYPFGSVITGDGFNRGLVRSQTDYVIFNGVMGLRGLDVAFIEPRARYHTDQDDSRHTSKDSLWHMLSGALSTTKKLSSHPLRTNLDPEDNPGSPGVWFDIFGQRFAAFQLHTLFALSVTLLVAGPVMLGLLMILLYSADKLYLFSGARRYHSIDGDDKVPLYGWRGFTRFPLVLTVSCAAPIALAFLLFKENEFIVHSSEWAVWSMMVSSFLFLAWFFCRMADYGRPSALTRAYGLGWIWTAWWVLLAAATVFEQQFHIGGVYFILFFAASAWLSTFLSYLELFSLEKKDVYCDSKASEDIASSAPETSRSRERQARASQGNDEDDQEEPTERSGLLSGRGGKAFRKYKTHDSDDEEGRKDDKHDADTQTEQEWARGQWSWLWNLQFLVIVPINVVIVGQIALNLVTALHQTGADGSSVFLVYISMAFFTIVLFSPLVPFIHRFSWQIPNFLLLVLIGTLIYNLVAFPFSANNRLKVFFQQEIDLETGHNNVSVIGPAPYVMDALRSLPSVSEQNLDYINADNFSTRRKYFFSGIAPEVAEYDPKLPASKRYRDWLDFSVTKTSNNTDSTKARFTIQGKNTRACKLVFDAPVQKFKVVGMGPTDERFQPVPQGGSKEIRLWSRTWENTWKVDVRWNNEKLADGMNGKVVCLWSDVNQRGVIPAYDEAQHYAPEWVAITKAGDGLLEGYKRFNV